MEKKRGMMMDDEYRKKLRKELRTVLTGLRRDWNGTLLPYVRLLERTGDPQNIAAAAHMRQVEESIIEAAMRIDPDKMEALSKEMDQCFKECSPDVDEQMKKAAAEVMAEGHTVKGA
jgi:hypothetical protein